MRKQIPYLLLAQAAILMILTCFVVVPPGHQAVMTHFGTVSETTAKPGLHITWPWPIDRATIIPVERIQRMVLGYKHTERDDEIDRNPNMEERVPILWTKKHYEQEYKLLVADRAASTDSKVPVNLLSVNMPVQWQVKHNSDAEVIRFEMQSADIQGIIESLAYRELTRYAASADINDLLGRGGIMAADTIRKQLQEACDDAGYDGKGLGVEIVYVGLGGIHPPQDEEVAQTYQDVVSAIETKDAKIMQSEGEAGKTRIDACGETWEQVYKAIVEEDRADASVAAQKAAKTAEVERLLRSVAGGKAREIVSNAEQNAYSRLFAEKSSAERYAQQMEAFNASPSTYMLRTYLRMVATSMTEVRKYVIAMNDASKVIYEIDLKPPAAVDILGAQVAAMEGKNEKSE
ncbi:MAG: hypothetical protein IPK83_12585 [Planctomycetes bacterium]|nr:hypothetical protein [Planctomycetota bacterium]